MSRTLPTLSQVVISCQWNFPANPFQTHTVLVWTFVIYWQRTAAAFGVCSPADYKIRMSNKRNQFWLPIEISVRWHLFQTKEWSGNIFSYSNRMFITTVHVLPSTSLRNYIRIVQQNRMSSKNMYLFVHNGSEKNNIRGKIVE